MTYELRFTPSAKKEWDKLDGSVRQVFIKVLKKRCINPIVPSAELKNLPIKCYKIKLRTIGYRLVYTLEDGAMILLVLAVNRRDAVYNDLEDVIKANQ